MIMMEQWQDERLACNHYDLSVTSRTICAALMGMLSLQE